MKPIFNELLLKALQVEDSLSRHETDRCLEWIADNRSKLRRLKSTLETTVRLQDCIELVRRGKLFYSLHIFLQLWTLPGICKTVGF